MKLSFVINNTPFSILCVYRSPSSDINEFLLILDNILKDEVNNKGYQIIIVDMNINIVGPSFTNNEYLDKISEYGYESFINVFTRTPLGSKHFYLDHIFVKSNNNVNIIGKIEADVIQTNITDHFSTVIGNQINNQNRQKINNVYKTINYSDPNEIYKENWNEVYINNNVNECYYIFMIKVESAISMTSITKTAISKNKCLKEWMTPGLLCSLRNKQKLS
jgi:hypothetical protein